MDFFEKENVVMSGAYTAQGAKTLAKCLRRHDKKTPWTKNSYQFFYCGEQPKFNMNRLYRFIFDTKYFYYLVMPLN